MIETFLFFLLIKNDKRRSNKTIKIKTTQFEKFKIHFNAFSCSIRGLFAL